MIGGQRYGIAGFSSAQHNIPYLGSMRARGSALPMAMICLFLAMGGAFHLSSIRLLLHWNSQRQLEAAVGFTEIKISERQYLENVKDRDEVLVGTRWFDIAEIFRQEGDVVLRGHFDDHESLLRSLVQRMSQDTGTDIAKCFFQFYFDDGVMPPVSLSVFWMSLSTFDVSGVPSFWFDHLLKPPAEFSSLI